MTSDVMIACVYPDMSYQFASRAYLETIGWKGEITGVSLEKVHGSEALFQLQHSLAKARQDGVASVQWQPDQHQASIWLQLEICWNSEAELFLLNVLNSELLSSRRAAKYPVDGLFDYTPQAVMVMDKENRIIKVNRGFTLVTGYRFDEVYGEGPGIVTNGDIDPDQFDHLWMQLHKRGVWEGELWNKHKNGQHYPAWFTMTARRDALGEEEGYVAQFSDISRLDSDRLEYHYSSYDPLTGLPDLRMFQYHLGRQQRKTHLQANTLAVLLVDLDRDNGVVEKLGSLVTEELLKEVAGRLDGVVREDDLVAYLGDNQFAILLTEASDSVLVENIAERILEQLALGAFINNQDLVVSGSVGIVISAEHDAMPEQLLGEARVAMQVAKNAGGNTFRVYQPDMQAGPGSQLIRPEVLRETLDNDGWELRFNPVYSLKNHNLVGAEVVPSWQHPELGLLHSDAFVAHLAVAELLQEYHYQIADKLRRFIPVWAGFEKFESIHLCLQDEELFSFGYISSLLRNMLRHDIAPQCLLVSLSAAQAMYFPDEVEQLKAQGVRLLIGGLESANLSLAELRNLSPDMLLFNADLVEGQMQDDRRAALVYTLLDMAESLQLEILAEGVRTTGQMARLHQQGCYRMSGKYVGRDLTMDQLIERLDTEA
ncbi:MAG: EAL domain-containing protein [Amphritea sp.]